MYINLVTGIIGTILYTVTVLVEFSGIRQSLVELRVLDN